MLRKLLLALGVLLASNLMLYSQSGTLKGKIIDKGTNEPIPFANVVIESAGRQVGGSTSDFDGNYTIKPITPGKYDLKATFVGYKPLLIKNIVINSDKITFYDINMESTAITIETFEVFDYKVPLISKDKTSTGGTVTAEEIARMPNRSANSVATTVGGVFSADGERGSVRGQRSEGTVMYIDGIKVRGSSALPQSAIEEVSVITGGLPARYGDATGGIINVTTKGPSRTFGGGLELQTSEFLDHYGYNRLGFSLQGPLVKSKKEENAPALLGYFLAGDLIYEGDGNPTSIGIYKVDDDVLEDLKQTPLRPSGTGSGSLLSSEFVREGDLEWMRTTENTSQYGANISAKIDVRTSPTINLSFGGSLSYNNFNEYDYSRSLFNYEKNPQSIQNTWRVFGKFTQRFPTDEKSKSIIKNVFYTIQADYSKFKSTRQDRDHKDNLFNYGHVGKFTTTKVNSYELGSDSVSGYDNVWVHNGFADILYEFEPGTANPVVAQYTSLYYSLYESPFGNYNNASQVQLGGGLLNGDQPESVYGLWQNVGQQFNLYSVQDATQVGIAAHGSADIGNHAIEFGIQYEQRSDGYYAYAPTGLWTLMRGLTNAHIEQLDKSNPNLIYDENGVFQDTIWYNRLYDGASQYFFDYNLRQKLGLAVDGTDWIDLDNYAPETFSIDMFSADELYRNGVNSLISYYGYDFKGNKLKGRPSFESFFTETDDYGNFTRNIGAYEPIYMAGYLQDVFSFKDLIFNVGLRVDRYDANQMVLKDPYLLYEAKSVSEVDNLGSHPGNMGEDFIVYVNDVNNPTTITGYRDGSTWYNQDGVEISDPEALNVGQGVSPYLVDPSNQTLSANAFQDYEPQTNLMPRISFSFPISDEALFFAHYDVLTQRPTGFSRLDPTDYLFIEARTGYINNPNLKPSKTIDYELGFQQKLSNTSSLNFSTFYREMRDMIQAYRFSGAYPVNYYSYNNIDFGTVKGLTVTYDLRRTSNARVRASYTLQFADGTGSDAESARALVSSGQPNLRTTNPLDYDRRHAFNIMLDYRFADGKDYNGPKFTRKVKGTDQRKTVLLLKNTGFNMTFNGGSGTPYSKSSRVYATQLGGGGAILKGSINGSRLPWQFRMDLRVDKDINLKTKKEDSRPMFLNIYLEMLNVLDAQNILSVYRATGNPDDDGYLTAAEYQAGIQAQTDEQAFRDQYAIKVNNPANYSQPRKIRLGVIFNF